MKFNFDFRQGLLADIINHHPEAFALHAANHPIEVRASEKAWKVDPLNISGLDVLAASFSPPCQHFSKVCKTVEEKR